MRYLENLSKSELKTIIAYNNDLRNMLEEKAWECMRVEYKEYRENPKDFGETTTEITKDYLYNLSDEDIEDLFELYMENGLINIED